MKKTLLFENVGGNEFKLNSEYIEQKSKIDLIREGLKKVFLNSEGKELSYKYISNIGMGYVKDVSEARKYALQEARIISKHYGYIDDTHNAKFIKENIDEPTTQATSILTPAEIGKQILQIIENSLRLDLHPYHEEGVHKIEELAKKLL